MIQTKKCLCCGKTIIKPQSKSQKDWENRTKYCSRQCINKGKKHTKKWKVRMSKWHKEHLSKSVFKKGHKSWNTGMRMPQMSGEKHPMWKGGRLKRQSGYIEILNKNHPFANSTGYVREHRLVMEKHLKRYLTSQEVVHHINGKRDDNRIENLMLFSTDKEHQKFHRAKLSI